MCGAMMKGPKSCFLLILVLAAPALAEGTWVTSSRDIAELLPERLAGLKATQGIKLYDPVAGGGAIYREYGIVEAASRQYGPLRLEVFRARDQFGALGLFSFISGSLPSGAPIRSRSGRAFIFCKGNFLMRASGPGRPCQKLAIAAGQLIGPAVSRLPTIIESLPPSPAPSAIRYFLGPESLGAYAGFGYGMWDFSGRAEAAAAEYKGGGKLIIIEYHTPQLAYDAMWRAEKYLRSVGQAERDQILLRREGNYILIAAGFSDRGLAEQLMSSVKYPYTVKWLRNPLLPTEDPFYSQKAAQVLLSTFAIIGLGMALAVIFGAAFGAAVFLKRRKQLRQVFSDAGGMLRLDLEPVPGVRPLLKGAEETYAELDPNS
jgi:hypothetical protein